MKHLFLVGNMGAGKSTVGALLAQRLSRPFYDIDTKIEHATQKTIPQIFAEQGERAFRAIESQTLARITSLKTPSVIACGGGAVLDNANRELMRQSGWIIYLKASVETLLSRILDPRSRPLLYPNPAERLQSIAHQRESLYQQADWIVETDTLSLDQVVDTLTRLSAPTPETPMTVSVLPDCPNYYTVAISPALRHAIADHLYSLGTPARIALLTHPHLTPFVQPIADAWHQHGIPTLILTFPSGERIKNLRTVEKLHRTLAQNGIDRHSWLIVVGGGVLGDIGGFVSATYMRGIAFVQVPTTLLAQVDSSIGGKAGVDLPEGKNLVGAFHQPMAVFIDPELLSTLPNRHWRNGFAEMLKYGMTLQQGLWLRLRTMIEQGWLTPRRVRKESSGWVLPIARCVQIKSDIVSVDERDTMGQRALLNFGHTVGHAIERVLGYKGWLHGEAISAGMVAEAQIGALLGTTPQAVLEELKETLQLAGLPTSPPPVDLDTLIEAMRTDKKRVGDQWHIVLPKSVGVAELVPNVPTRLIQEALRRCVSLSQ